MIQNVQITAYVSDQNKENPEINVAWAIHDTLQDHIATSQLCNNKARDAMSNHSCCKSCNMQELTVFYTHNAHLNSVDFIVNPTQTALLSSTRQQLHGLFFCTEYYKLHLCGPGICKLPAGYGLCEDGSYACLLSGTIVDSGEWQGKTWQQDEKDKGSSEHISWKLERQNSKRESQSEKLWNSQFDSLKSDVMGFQQLLCELLPGGVHSKRINLRIKAGIMAKCRMQILTRIKRHIVAASKAEATDASLYSRCHSYVDLMKIKEIILGALRKCHIECNGFRLMCVTARQRRSIANAYTASIFTLYNELLSSKWTRVKGTGPSSDTCITPRRAMRFVQFGFNVLMISQSGLSFSNNHVIAKDSYLVSALPCVHHILKDEVLLKHHPYIRYMAKSTNRMLSMFKEHQKLPFLAPVDAYKSACTFMELKFCAEGPNGSEQSFCL